MEIFPENKEATEYLVKAYVQDCKVNERSCKKGIEILDKLIGINPNNLEYKPYRISLEMTTTMPNKYSPCRSFFFTEKELVNLKIKKPKKLIE